MNQPTSRTLLSGSARWLRNALLAVTCLTLANTLSGCVTDCDAAHIQPGDSCSFVLSDCNEDGDFRVLCTTESDGLTICDCFQDAVFVSSFEGQDVACHEMAGRAMHGDCLWR